MRTSSLLLCAFINKLIKEKIDYLILILFILSSTITLLIFQIRNSQKLIVLTIQDNHSIITNKTNLLDLNIKCSRQDTMYMNKEMFYNTYILDYTTKDTYMIDLVDIIYQSRFSYQHDSYFDYKLTFNIPFNSTQEIELFKIIYENDNPEKAVLTAIEIFTAFLEQPEAVPVLRPVCLQESS